MRPDSFPPRWFLPREGGDDLRRYLGEVGVVVRIHAQDRGNDLERQRHRETGDQVDVSRYGEPVEEIADNRVDQREGIRLELPADQDGRNDLRVGHRDRLHPSGPSSDR
jgi:hypothetical protein